MLKTAEEQQAEEDQAAFRFGRRVTLACILIFVCFAVPYLAVEVANCEISCGPTSWADLMRAFLIGGYFCMFPGMWLLIFISNWRLRPSGQSDRINNYM